MAVGDIPGIPKEHIPRAQRLVERLRNNEITLEAVRDNALSTLGRMRVSSSGVTVTGEAGVFELDAGSLKALLGAMKKAVETVPLFMGKELYLKEGSKITHLKIGLRMKKRSATESEIKSSTLPVIEFDPKISSKDSIINAIEYRVQGLGGTIPSPPPRFKIRRMEELAGWFKGWEDLAKVMRIAVPAVPLTTKSVLDKLGEPVPAFSDLVLKKCGV